LICIPVGRPPPFTLVPPSRQRAATHPDHQPKWPEDAIRQVVMDGFAMHARQGQFISVDGGNIAGFLSLAALSSCA
jgi:hypothetical protein